ncbi:MAG: hypothetical protein ABS911_12565 [Carnobacterium sp.]|uniref:hypothetical protein n=1 Tax=Carnobacterium sp. TaxID=48221 RepID=UPI003314F385
MANAVYSKTLNKIITVDEFVSLEDANEIEDTIFCETKNCEARFIYHSASESRGHHFQKFPGKEHSEFCELKTTQFVTRNKTYSEKIKSTLSDDGYDNTLSSVLKFLEPKLRPLLAESLNSGPKKKKSVKTDKNSEPTNNINPEFTLEESKEDKDKKEKIIADGGKVRNPSIFRVSLNQLSEKHNSSIKKTYGIIKKIKEFNDHSFEISIKDIDSEKKATLVLKEAFFSETSDVGLPDYLRMLKSYTAKKESKDVIVLTVFELKEFNEEDIVLYINDEIGFRVVIDDGSSKLKNRKLVQFAILYNTKSI